MSSQKVEITANARQGAKPPVQIVLTQELDRKLSELAEKRGDSRSVVVREALRQLFANEERGVS